MQSELLQAVEDFCRASGVDNPTLAAQQFVLLANGYLITEILLGKASALTLTTQTAQVLIRSVGTPKATSQKVASKEGRQVRIPIPDPTILSVG